MRTTLAVLRFLPAVYREGRASLDIMDLRLGRGVNRLSSRSIFETGIMGNMPDFTEDTQSSRRAEH